MKDFDALKDIWHSQLAAPKISDEAILKSIRQAKSGFANKLLFEIVGMLAAIVLFTLIWVNSPSMMWTTHLALFLFLLCCFYYFFAQLSDYKTISNSEHLLKQPNEYIAYLKQYQRKRYLFNTNKYRIYSIITGIAFGLYFIEIYFSSPLWQTIVGVASTIIWFIICGYLMRIYIRKEQQKLYEMIQNLEKLEKQLVM